MIVNIVGNQNNADMLIKDFVNKKFLCMAYKGRGKDSVYFLVGYFTDKGLLWDWMERRELCLRPKHAYKSKKEAVEAFMHDENVQFRYYDCVEDVYDWLGKTWYVE